MKYKKTSKQCKTCKYWEGKPNEYNKVTKYDSFMDYFVNEFLWYKILKPKTDWIIDDLGENIKIWKPDDISFKGISGQKIKDLLKEAKEHIKSFGMTRINFKKCSVKKIEAYENGVWWDTKRAYYDYDSDIDNGDQGYGHGEEFVTGKDFYCNLWEEK